MAQVQQRGGPQPEGAEVLAEAAGVGREGSYVMRPCLGSPTPPPKAPQTRIL